MSGVGGICATVCAIQGPHPPGDVGEDGLPVILMEDLMPVALVKLQLSPGMGISPVPMITAPDSPLTWSVRYSLVRKEPILWPRM